MIYFQVIRKSLAKYLILINNQYRFEVKYQFKDKSESKKPYCIRKKKTRAIRRKMSKN